jgi:hypothetical protein
VHGEYQYLMTSGSVNGSCIGISSPEQAPRRIRQHVSISTFSFSSFLTCVSVVIAKVVGVEDGMKLKAGGLEDKAVLALNATVTVQTRAALVGSAISNSTQHDAHDILGT